MDFGRKIKIFCSILDQQRFSCGKPLVKNDKVKKVKTGEKQHNIHKNKCFIWRNPNLHQIHNITKPSPCKYIFFFFQYHFIGSLPGLDSSENDKTGIEKINIFLLIFAFNSLCRYFFNNKKASSFFSDS